MPKSKFIITYDHDDVVQLILRDIMVSTGQENLKASDLRFGLQEARVNEGYTGSGPDQKARILYVTYEREQ